MPKLLNPPKNYRPIKRGAKNRCFGCGHHIKSGAAYNVARYICERGNPSNWDATPFPGMVCDGHKRESGGAK